MPSHPGQGSSSGSTGSILNDILGFDDNDIIVNNLTTATGNPLATRQTYFKALESWEANIAASNYFLVVFDLPVIVTDTSMKQWGEQLSSSFPWGVDIAKKRLQDDPAYQRYVGCIFCTGASLPQETISVSYAGFNNRGFIKAPFIQDRQAYAQVQLEMYESNLSYLDFVLRPWMILCSHYGLTARENSLEKVTTDVYIIELSRAGYAASMGAAGGQDNGAPYNIKGLMPRKITILKDAFPGESPSKTVNFGQGEGITRSGVGFYYSRYQHILPYTTINQTQPTTSQIPARPSSKYPVGSSDASAAFTARAAARTASIEEANAKNASTRIGIGEVIRGTASIPGKVVKGGFNSLKNIFK